MSMRTGSLALVVAAVAAWAPRGAAAAPLPGYRPGESFIFNFSVGAVQAGRARLAVGAPTLTPSGARVAIQGDAESAPWLQLIARVQDTYKAQLDADGAPATRRVRIEEHGVRERTIDFVLDKLATGSLLHLEMVRPREKRSELHPLPGAPLDLVAALFFIRFRPLAIGERFEFVFFDGPLFYRAQASVAGREEVNWSGGVARAIHVDIDAVRVDWGYKPHKNPERKKARLLLSDDESHVPYLIEGDTDFGVCRMELVGYIPGKPPVRLPSSTGNRPPEPQPAQGAAADVPRTPMVLRPSPTPE
jgi:hypothetical protein